MSEISGSVKVIHNSEIVHVCRNVDAKPDNVPSHTLLWVYDTDTYFWSPDGHNWVQTKGRNSIFSYP